MGGNTYSLSLKGGEGASFAGAYSEKLIQSFLLQVPSLHGSFKRVDKKSPISGKSIGSRALVAWAV